MKKQSKIIIGLMIAIIISLINVNKVYADPNSSKGFAEYDDNTATEQNQEMLEEQQKEFEQNVGKSSNNYLENLQIEGYDFTPRI